MGGKRTLALGRKLQPLEQHSEARVAADRIEERIALEAEETRIAHLDRLVERGEGAVGIAELGMDLAILVACLVAI